MANKTAKINAGSVDALIKLFGSCDENINMIKDKLDVEVVNSKGEFCFSGEEENVDAALEVVKKLLNYIAKGEEADIGRVSYICDCALDGRLDEIDQLLNDVVAVTYRGKLIKSKTVGQKKYVDAIKKNIAGNAGAGQLPEAYGKGCDRGCSSCLYARQDAQQRFYYSRRGAKHHAGADENVFDKTGRKQYNGSYGRPYSDRFARGQKKRSEKRRKRA